MYPINSLVPSRHLDRYGTMPKAFSDEEIDRILFFEKILPFKCGEVGHGDTVREETALRKSEVAHFHIDDNTRWLWEKLAHLTGTANYDLFLYDVEAIETIQFTRYNGSSDAEESGHYTWHTDALTNNYKKYDRKISGVMLLSDVTEFTGGDFEIDIHGRLMPLKVNLEKGDLFFFDSHRSHRVTPVTSGIRKSLVFWILGKNQL